MHANPVSYEGYGPEPAAPPDDQDGIPVDDGKAKGHWDKRLTGFQKMMFIKAFQEEKVNSLDILLHIIDAV